MAQLPDLALCENDFLQHLAELLGADADVISQAELVTDPGYVLVRLYNGQEFAITVEAK